MPEIVLPESVGYRVLGHCYRTELAEGDLPECLVVGGRVFVRRVDEAHRRALLFKLAGLPIAARYVEIHTMNFDAIKREGRGDVSPIQWQPGCAPIGEAENMIEYEEGSSCGGCGGRIAEEPNGCAPWCSRPFCGDPKDDPKPPAVKQEQHGYRGVVLGVLLPAPSASAPRENTSG